MSLVLQSSGGGSVTLQEAVTASNLTITVPAVTGTMAIQGPAFSAYLGSGQNISSATWTKVQLNIEEFDTASAFDNTTNYRFTPTVAGYYQITAALVPTTAATQANIAIYKNGIIFKSIQCIGTFTGALVTSLVYLNGSSDYVESYAFLVGTTPTMSGNLSDTYFQAALIRSA